MATEIKSLQLPIDFCELFVPMGYGHFNRGLCSADGVGEITDFRVGSRQGGEGHRLWMLGQATSILCEADC